MLRIAIVDDEMAEIQKLQELVEQFFREKQVAYQITSYISGETFLVAQQQCDLIFLDVQMTGIDGIATARNIRQNDRKAALIYVSNFSEKMADSFAVHPFCFSGKAGHAGKAVDALAGLPGLLRVPAGLPERCAYAERRAWQPDRPRAGHPLSGICGEPQGADTPETGRKKRFTAALQNFCSCWSRFTSYHHTKAIS